MRFLRVFACLFVAAAVAGCDKGSSGQEYPNTPEGIVRKMLDSGLKKDVTRFRECLPTDDELRFVCDTKGQLDEAIEQREKQIRGLYEDGAHTRLHIWYEDIRCEKITEEHQGLATAKVHVTMCSRKNGEVEKQDGTMNAIRINGRWIAE